MGIKIFDGLSPRLFKDLLNLFCSLEWNPVGEAGRGGDFISWEFGKEVKRDDSTGDCAEGKDE